VPRVLERRGIRRGHPDYEDRLAELIGDAWNLHGKYDPSRDRARSKGREPNMAAWVFLKLGQRPRRLLPSRSRDRDQERQHGLRLADPNVANLGAVRACQRRAARSYLDGSWSARRRQSSSASTRPTWWSSAAAERAARALRLSSARRKRA